jgi:hypothetical protein
MVAGQAGDITINDQLVVAHPVQPETSWWAPIRRLTVGGPDCPWSVAIDDFDPYRACYQWKPAPRLATQAADRLGELVDAAWRLIVREHPRHAAAIAPSLRCLVPLTAGPGRADVSAASRTSYGAVALGVPRDADTVALLLLHEAAHMRLWALLDVVDLHTNTAALHYAPWRADPRPVGALLHGTYAHVAVTDFWRHRRHSSGAAGHAAFAYWRAATWRATTELLECGELTNHGAAVVRALRQTMQPWQREPVPDAVVAEAADAVQVQTLTWRLTHLRPTSAQVATLVDAWQTGRVCPAWPAAERPRPAAAANAPVPTQPEAVMINHAEDLARYSSMIMAGGLSEASEVQAWLMLSRCCWHVHQPGGTVLTDRPELVRAVHQALAATGHQLDPVALAAWFDQAPVRGASHYVGGGSMSQSRR